MAGLALIAVGALAAPCGDPAAALDDAYAALQTLDLARVEQRVAEAQAAFGCGPVAPPSQLGRFWLAKGVARGLAADADAASDAMAAARRADPGLRGDAWGAEVASLWSAAGAPAGTGHLLTATELGRGDFTVIDGQPATFPAEVAAGLHVVQVGRFDTAFWAAEVYVQPGVDVSLEVVRPKAGELPKLWSGTVQVGLYADASFGSALAVDVDGSTWNQARTQIGIPLELGYEFYTRRVWIRPAALIAPLLNGPYVYAGEEEPVRFPLAIAGGVEGGLRLGEAGRVGLLAQVGYPGQVRTRATGSCRVARGFHLEGRGGANFPAEQPVEAAFDLGVVWLPGT